MRIAVPGNKKLDMKKPENIVLVMRTGGDYSIRDVKLLSERLVENSDIPVKVWCLTNIVPKDQVINLQNVTLLPFENDWPGWWAKINMFSPKLEHLRPFLYMDLDTAPLKPISSVFKAVKNRGSLIMLRNFFHPEKKGTSGFMWIPANDERLVTIWEKFKKSPEEYMLRYKVGGDQVFMNSIIKEPDEYWQDLNKGIVSYKIDERIKPPTAKARIKRTALHGTEDVVIFHGQPRMWQAAHNSPWLKDYLGYYLHDFYVDKGAFNFDVIKHIDPAHGISDAQVRLLYSIATGMKGICLEIGSYLGRSACAIATGLKVSGSGRLYCIDAWENRKGGMPFDLFLSNIQKAGCENYITPVQNFSENVFEERIYPEGLFKGKIQFLFIDATHSYQGVKSDIRWIELVAKHGIIAFHDYENPMCPGVKKAVDEFVQNNPGLLKLRQREGSLIVFSKVK